ncbi:MAG: ATP synthase F1 subunit delta [Flavisolibacter sp.]|nr:ATP synthase F1 subunit delta [Flavisolibacter sp.]MBD0375308.1 ATP synthase F1 subunit delta [Flavisolibacter sp.]
MLHTRVASRYAKSLLNLATEQGKLEQVYNDMLYLQQLTKSSRDFLNLLRSPVIKGDRKIKIVETITAGNIDDLTAAFNRLLISKGREDVLPEIITSFIKQYKEQKGIHIVKLTTAVPASENVKNAIVNQIRKTSDMQKIELETIVDPKVIGGFVLETGDKLVDASIAYDLKEIARQFENNDFIYRLR